MVKINIDHSNPAVQKMLAASKLFYSVAGFCLFLLAATYLGARLAEAITGESFYLFLVPIIVLGVMAPVAQAVEMMDKHGESGRELCIRAAISVGLFHAVLLSGCVVYALTASAWIAVPVGIATLPVYLIWVAHRIDLTQKIGPAST